MSSRANFVTRERCPWAIGDSEPEVLLERPFTDPSIWGFLGGYYEGRIERSTLDGATYRLLRCTETGFVWQEQILDDEWMDTLYSKWISPDASKAKKVLYVCPRNALRLPNVEAASRMCWISFSNWPPLSIHLSATI